MSKQLNIDLRFNADTSAAKTQLQSLQASINQLTTGLVAQGAQLGITPKIQEAQQAAAQLKTALSESMNVNTGKFDLSKFNSSLKSMNTDLGKLKTQLTSIGPQGSQAFMSLAQSIMTAEIPTKRISASLSALGNTLKNTAKWQLSSSLLHGFIGAIRTSYNYAQNLNESLNNIRIVTGLGTNEMDKFAAKANRAAKALSISTLQYTDASLIFYQQGLRGKAVEERAEVAAKMANVSGQSAEIVSDQLTAIWNNFADGTQSLESFADKMVALGAATASSSDEIAGGLEKFAAIGDTIGLSFDYAAAALATITSNTRQSEEVVGTALKTIFARIQGLKLGETLEDGVELNKYSQALESIGVDIFDANENLKNMDTILDETAAKWGTLTKAQQTATAQTVAGIRQYNQFIALMDNWNDGTEDSMVANLNTVAGSNGALQEQQDIYAESWEAANKRVKVAAEQVYSDLLNDDFFITLTNRFGDFLELLDNFLDSMGGAKGLLSGLASLLLNAFAGSAAKGLENMVYNFKSFVGIAQKEAMAIQNATLNAVKGGVGTGKTVDTSTAEGKMVSVTNAVIEKQIELKHQLITKGKELGDQEKLIAQYIIEQNEAMGQQLIKAQELANQAANEKNAARNTILEQSINPNSREVTWGLNNIDQEVAFGEVIKQELDKLDQEFLEGKIKVDEYVFGLKRLEDRANFGDSIVKELDKLDQELKEGKINAEEYKKKLDELKQSTPMRTGEESQLGGYIKNRYTNKDGSEVSSERTLKSRANDPDKEERTNIYAREDAKAVATKKHKNAFDGVNSKNLDKYARSSQNLVKANKKVVDSNKALEQSTDDASKKINALTKPTASWSQNLVGTAQAAMSLSFAISSLGSVITTWEDSTKSVGEKLLQTFMSLGIAIPMLINGLNGLSTITGISALMSNKKAIAATSEIMAIEGVSVAEQEAALQKTLGITATQASAVASAIKAGASVEEALATEGVLQSEKKGILVKAASKIWSLAVAAATGILTAMKGAETVSVWANTAAWYANPIMWIAAVIIAIVAALVGLIAYFAIFNNTLSDNEQALADAEASLERLTAAYDMAKQKAEEFKEAVSNYDEARKGLKDLEKGTVEYSEQLRKANEYASELIKNFSQELQGKYEVVAGEIVIDEQALQEVQKKMNDSVVSAALAKNRGELEVSKAKYNVNKDAIKENSEYTKNYSHLSEQFLDKWMSHYEGLTKEEQQTTTQEDIKQFILDNSLYNRSDEVVSDMADKIMDTTGKLDELNATQQANIEALKANTAALLEEKYGEDFIDEYGEAAVAGAEEQILEEKSKDFQGSGKTATEYYRSKNLRGGGFDNNDLVDSGLTIEEKEHLATMAGIEYDQITDGELEYDGGANGGKWTLYDNDGNVKSTWTGEEFNKGMTELTNPVTQEEVEEQLSTAEGRQAANQTALDSGLYSADDVRRETGNFAGITEGKAQSLEKKDFGEYGQEAQKYIESLPAAMKESMADAMLQLSKEDIKSAGSVEKAMKKAENDQRGKTYAAELGIDTDEFEQYTDNVLKNNKALNDNKEAAQQVAKQQIETNREIKKLGESYADLKDDLDIANKGTEEFNAACGKMADALNDVFDGASFDSQFVEDNLDTIQKAIEGDVAAAEKLFDLAGQDLILEATGVLDAESLTGVAKEVNDWIGSQEFNNLEIGTTLDDSGMTEKFQQMLDSGQVTADEMNNILSGIGYAPEIEYVEVKTVGAADQNGYSEVTYDIPDPDDPEKTIEKKVKVKTSAIEKVGGAQKIPIIKGKKTVKSTTPKSFASTAAKANNSKSGSGSGSGSETKPAKKSRLTKKSDTVERYKEINNALENVQDTLDDTSTAMDKLWGAKRIQAMEKYSNTLQKQYILQQKYRDEVKQNLASDKQAIQDFMQEMPNGEIGGLGDLGLAFEFDANGYITNYTAIMEQLHNKLNALETQKNNMATEEQQSTFDDEILGPFQDKISWLQGLISSYEETNGLLIEADNTVRDTLDQIRQSTLDTINYSVEVSVEMNDIALQYLEYMLSKIEDDFYKIAEAAEFNTDKLKISMVDLELAYKPYNDLLYAFNEGIGGITFEDVTAAAKDAIPNLIAALQNIQQLDRDMLEYYSNGLNMAQEKFEKYNTFLDSASTKLDHYRSMLSLIGKEMDYDKTGVILQGQYDVAKNAVETSKAYYEGLQSEYKVLYERWLQEKDTLSEYERKMLEQQLYDAKTAVTEAEEQYLSSLENTGSIAQEILQNNLDKAKKTLEQNLVGSSFEDYMTDLDRLSKKQEEYLTNTNKMYETNKLIRQAQQAMDKTENNRAKQQYNDYVKYIEQLQESGQLSQNELSIAQAKYEVLQAQIALEEAQDAKNQVRLTRDAEGNYGYVYTANEDKISEAQQALEDAENKLYNIGLDGAKDYQSKYSETMQAAVEEFASINEQYQSGQIASEEEYNQKMQEAKQYYYDLLKQYNELYYQSHDLLVEESYTNQADYLLAGIGNIEEFADSTDAYLEEVNDYFDAYDENVSDITEIVDGNLQTLEDGTNDVVVESDNLATTITNEVVPALSNELKGLREVTSAYGIQRKELDDTIKKYEEYIEKLQTVAEYTTNGGSDFSNISDFSLEIEKWIGAGIDVNSPMIQDLLEARWEKMGGVDTYNYAAMMEEEFAENGDSDWYKTLQAMREYKIFKTDWSAYQAANPDATWVDEVRKQKLSGDFEKEIEQYISRGGSMTDSFVTDRQALIAVRDSEAAAANVPVQEETTEPEVVEEEKEEESTTPTEAEIKTQAQEIYNQIMKGTYGNGWDNRREKAKEQFGDKYIPDAFELAKKVINKQASFDTGGYTGSWGPEGKLAILHEKELVLNKQDTENFLTATSMLKEISEMLDNNALVASLGAINLRAMTINSPADQVLQQDVTIHAEFPNVTEHTEIELAIDNLINAASQHAYRA